MAEHEVRGAGWRSQKPINPMTEKGGMDGERDGCHPGEGDSARRDRSRSVGPGVSDEAAVVFARVGAAPVVLRMSASRAVPVPGSGGVLSMLVRRGGERARTRPRQGEQRGTHRALEPEERGGARSRDLHRSDPSRPRAHPRRVREPAIEHGDREAALHHLQRARALAADCERHAVDRAPELK